MRPAGRERERAPREDADEALLRVEKLEERSEILLVGSAAVQEHERALGRAGRGPDVMGDGGALHLVSLEGQVVRQRQSRSRFPCRSWPRP